MALRGKAEPLIPLSGIRGLHQLTQEKGKRSVRRFLSWGCGQATASRLGGVKRVCAHTDAS